MSSAWQHPHVNVFKTFGVGQWKKCSKEGDVYSLMDREIKATVFRVLGSIPAANYIQIPKTASQSLSLTGPFVYITFKPLPSKYFVIHFEVVISSGMVVRISFSNLFREFKSTLTWLQFPFALNDPDANSDPKGHQSPSLDSSTVPTVTPSSARWTLLKLNLKEIITQYLHTKFSYVKNMKICANLLVKNVLTSDIDYCPLSGDSIPTSAFPQPLPKEISFPLAKEENFLDKYDYVQCPRVHVDVNKTKRNLYSNKLKGMHSLMTYMPSSEGKKEREVSAESTMKGSIIREGVERRQNVAGHKGRAEVATTQSKSSKFRAVKEAREEHPSQVTSSVEGGGREEVHVYTDEGAEVSIQYGRDKQIVVRNSHQMKADFHSLQPDPILRLDKVIGFGGHSTGQVLFGGDGESVIYPCHALVINMDIPTGQQKFYIGHTDKVSCISVNVSGTLLASGQAGSLPMVRLWDVLSTRCLAMFKTHSSGLHKLSFSHSGSVLCGVGKDGRGKVQVVLWNTAQASRSGDVSVITKAHTDAAIDQMRIAGFDDSRMASCGWDNVRFWRLRNGSLRSCPVNLEKRPHQLHFTDIHFQPGFHNESDLSDRNVYSCTKTGHVFEIHYKTMSVKRVWHILPSISGGVSIHTLSVHEAFCVTGSADGTLRVWPLDFSAVCMEAEHDGAVSAVSISEDGMRVLAGTTSGNIGLLDAGKNSYTTLMRSHRAHVQCMSLQASADSPWLVTCSRDQTVRVWDAGTGTQLYDFHAPDDHGSSVAWHPMKQVFACGFNSGAVRVFHLPTTVLLSEHKHHKGIITGIVFSPKGHILYSCSNSGSLAMYDVSDVKAIKVSRVLGNTVAMGKGLGPCALSVSGNGERLAFIGPLESTVTVLDAKSLDEVLRLDITSMTTPHSPLGLPDTPALDSALTVTFAPNTLNQLLVLTTGSQLLKFSASQGQLLSEVSHIHRTQSTALTVGKDSRYIFTAGDNTIKVWDYWMSLDLNFQVFIGHSEAVNQICLTNDGNRIVSCGDAIFLWEFLGTTLHSSQPPTSTPPHSPHRPATNTRSALPRAKPPAPMSYEPIKMQSFTPMGPASRHKPMQTSVEQGITLHVDDDDMYEPHTDNDTSSDEPQSIDTRTTEGGAPNVNVHFSKHRNSDMEETSASESGDEADGSKKRVGTHVSDPDSMGIVHPKTPPPSQPHPLEAPLSLKHYHYRLPKSCLAKLRYIAPPDQAALNRRMVLGVNGSGRNNVIWEPNSGLFVYSSGCVLVVEDLSNGEQKHLTGHTEEISTLAVQHDGRLVASASPTFEHTPCEVRIWKINMAKCTKVLRVHNHSVQCMDFSRDDRLLLSVGTYRDSALAVWSTHKFDLLRAITLDHPVHDVKWDPRVSYEFTSVGTAIKFWLVEENGGGKTWELKVCEPRIPDEVLQTETETGLEFTSVCYGQNSMLFIGTNFGVLTLWDTKENVCLMYWKTDFHEISTLFSSGDKLFSADINGSLKLWTVGKGTFDSLPVVTLEKEMDVSGAVFSSSFDSDVELGVVGTSMGCAYYISWTDNTQLSLVNGVSMTITSITFNEDSSHLAITSEDGSLAVWKVDVMEQIILFQAPKKSCNCAAFAPIVSSSANEQGQVEKPPLLTLTDIVAGYSDGTLRIFDSKTIKMTKKMQPHAEPVNTIAYSSDGHVVLSGCSSGMIVISNPLTGLVVRVITDHQGAPITDMHVVEKPFKLTGLDLKEGSLWLVASGDRRVSVWTSEWSRGNCQLVDWLTFPGPSIAPDGTRLKQGSKCQYNLLPPSLVRMSPANPDTIIYTGYGFEMCVQFYSLSKKSVIRTCALTHWATTMDLSPDGLLLAFGDEERVLKVMDSEEGSFQDYTGHQDLISKVKFSIDGKLLMSSSGTLLQLWNVSL